MDFRHNLNNLKKDFSDGKRFTLFIGAGINSGKDIHLLWNELVREACEYSFRRIGQNMNLTEPEIEYLLSILGIMPSDFDKILPNTDNRRTLLKRFSEYCNSKDYVVSHFPVEIQVSIIKTLLGDSYIPFLQDYLYSQCNKDKIRYFFKDYELKNLNASKHDNLYSLYVVARMVLLNPQIEAVISYNYDNFLSYAIWWLLYNYDLFFTEEEIGFLLHRYNVCDAIRLKEKIPAVDIGNANLDKEEIPNEAVRIYHVHGYIPSVDEQQYAKSPSIVLSIDEFFALINDSSSWNYTAQLNSIMTTNCLFIGSSLTDLSTKRMLNMASAQPIKTNKYVLDAYTPMDRNKLHTNPKEILREIKDHYLKNIGVSVIDCDEGFDRLFSEIAKISNVKTKRHIL